jgi:hypothetical protein
MKDKIDNYSDFHTKVKQIISKYRPVSKPAHVKKTCRECSSYAETRVLIDYVNGALSS